MSARYLSAREAAAELEISLATLYAYVSRGLIRSEQDGAAGNTRRYAAADVQRLKQRKEGRRNPAKAVTDALHWGMPILDSAITLIADGQVFYRGEAVERLAQTRTFEQVAALIWLGAMDSSTALWAATDRTLPHAIADLLSPLGTLPPIVRFQTVLPLVAAHDVAAYDLRPHAVTRTGARVLYLLALVATDGQPLRGSIAATLQQHWCPNDPDAAAVLNTALILCADHELNPSSFTARCIASAGATPYAVVSGGLAALSGVKHGLQTERVELLLREIELHGDVQRGLAERLKHGLGIDGFGHPLYPQGDPRGRLLLAELARLYPESPAVALSRELSTAVADLIGEQPTIDLALATLARALDLPAGAALALFALGRSVGWIGHAIEQYAADQLIRPRARYVGPHPVAD